MELTLAIREVGGPLHPIVPAGTLPGGFLREACDYEFVLGGPGAGTAVVVAGGRELDVLLRRGERVLPFRTDGYAGELRLACLDGNGRRLAAVDLVVDPDLAKATREDYATMVEQLAEDTAALYRLGGLALPGGIGKGARPDVIVAELVRSHFAMLRTALERIGDAPRRILRDTSSERDLASVVRLSDAGLAWGLRQPAVRTAAPAEAAAFPLLMRATCGLWVPKVRQARREESLDIYEHRAFAGFLAWLRGTLSGMLGRVPRGGDAATRAHADRLATLRRQTERLMALPFLAGSRPDFFLRPTPAFTRHPDYALAYRAMMAMRAGLNGTWSDGLPRPTVDRTWQLYETWCWLRILRVAAEEHPAARGRIARLLDLDLARGAFQAEVASGRDESVQLGDGLLLGYHVRYSREGVDCRTALLEAIPDIVVERRAEGRTTGLVVLDPKYRRMGGSLAQGVRDLHFYRDAILRADGSRAVLGAAVMAPRPDLPVMGDRMPIDRPGIVRVPAGSGLDVFRDLLGLAVRTLDAVA